MKKVLLIGCGSEIGSTLLALSEPEKDGFRISAVLTNEIPRDPNHPELTGLDSLIARIVITNPNMYDLVEADYSNNKIIGTYVNSILALHDAIDKEADEALLLDKNGFLSEGSGENIFIVKDSILYTPRTDFCLNGITRQSVIEIAGRMDIPIQEKDLTYDDMLDADEAFFSGTAVEITPITILDKKPIGNGLRGKITEKLQLKYSEIVSGQDSNYDHWLTRL